MPETLTAPFTLTPADFEKTYYGIPVISSGDEGDMLALGHHGKLRVLAAFNRYARKVIGLDNLGDDRTLRASDFLNDITERWGVPRRATEEEQRNEGFLWVIEHSDADAPGAMPYTHLSMA